MSVQVLNDCTILIGQYDITSWSTMLEMGGSVAMKPATPFGVGGYARQLPGIHAHESTFKGMADYAAAAVSTVLTPAQLGTQYAVTAMPHGGASVGDAAIFTRGLLKNLKTPQGPVGEIAGYEMGFGSDSRMIDGYVLAPLASRTTAGYTGTAVALTGPSATQYLWAALHVTAAAGTNLAVKVQTDNASNFPSPTDRITFSTVSAVGWQFMAIAGDFSTETHVRAIATIGTSTFSFACAAGVK